MPTLYDYSLPSIDGSTLAFADFHDRAVLLVNVASQCGLTPQYRGLEQLWLDNREHGLVVVGLPCNQFGAQEPGTEAQIAQFCELNYGVSFPLTAKVEVNGPGRHPLYQWLAGDDSPFPGPLQWNFEKFLVGRDGQLAARYSPMVKPQDASLIEKIAELLA